MSAFSYYDVDFFPTSSHKVSLSLSLFDLISSKLHSLRETPAEGKQVNSRNFGMFFGEVNSFIHAVHAEQ